MRKPHRPTGKPSPALPDRIAGQDLIADPDLKEAQDQIADQGRIGARDQIADPDLKARPIVGHAKVARPGQTAAGQTVREARVAIAVTVPVVRIVVHAAMIAGRAVQGQTGSHACSRALLRRPAQALTLTTRLPSSWR